MIRRRDKPDGLPYRVYERHGKRVYSIGLKGSDGKWAFRLQCPIGAPAEIVKLRAEAIQRAARASLPSPVAGTFAALSTAWLTYQEGLPVSSPLKRATSTLAENRRELVMLNRAFGLMLVAEMEKADAYAYLDACLVARNPKTGEPRPRPEKGNKEIALARVVLEYGVRLGQIKSNPFDGVQALPTVRRDHYVEAHDMALAVRVGRALGPQFHIVAMALQVAYLCVRRSVEVRALTRPQITEDGIEWVPGKRRATTAERKVLIEWSPALRTAVDEALSIQRGKLAGSWYVFGNLQGQRYTKGGWGKTLRTLMDACEATARAEGLPFARFSLQDCRPKGVSDKLSRGHQDVQDATAHTTDRMVRQVYDRRRVRRASPTE